MTIEVLIATMHQKDTSLVKKMNIQSDAIIVNQTDVYAYQELLQDDCRIRFYSFAERGVGLSRNSSLMRSNADVCILADDDMVFHDGYGDVVQDTFDHYRDADVIIFNLSEAGATNRVNNKPHSVKLSNYMNYGAARIAFRRHAVVYHGISFNLNFGGGTRHQCGEDTLFLRDCLKAGLKIIAVPLSLATLSETRPSTWFHGYTRKYLFDKGVVLSIAHPRMVWLFCLYLTLRHPEYAVNDLDRAGVFREMCKGIRYVKRKEYYEQGNI